MICQACQHENPVGNAFCGGCGAALAALCPKCGESNPPENGFCGKCGQRLAPETGAEKAAAEPETGERRQLTVLFCDLVGSTDLAARLDPEEYREALRAYHTRTDEVITRYGGYVAQHLGDGLLVYFGWPQTYDDATERAVRAGLGLIEATATVQAGGASLAARVGLHTGAVVVSDVGTGRHHEMLAVGDTPNVAARVQGAAAPGEVCITAATHRLVAGLFLVEERGAQPLKGVAQPVELYRVIQSSGARGRLGAAAVHGLTPFVNRGEERAMLRSRFDRACDGEGQVVLLTGEAGIGKSRLARVLCDELGDTAHTWLETGGSAHYASTPFYAVTELLTERRPWDEDTPAARAKGLVESLHRAGVDPNEALPLLAPLLDVPVPEGYRPMVSAPEVLRKRLLATLAAWVFGTARLQPLVILVEDLHWVDPSSLELLQLLVVQGATVPLLLLCTARPQFQAPWPSRAHHTHLTLSNLAKRHVREMVVRVAAQTDLLAEVVDTLAGRTGGVPLFVEELTKAVVEIGAVAAARQIPSTLADSLMARLDRLGPQAREVAQVGAVCGREFSFALLQAVHPLAPAELEAALLKLINAELVHARGLPPEATYTFKHALVQDAAYASLLKSRCRALHAQVAAMLAQQFPALADAHPELLAHHYTEAGQLEAAVPLWQRAGEHAIARGALQEAGRHLQRGVDALSGLPEGTARDGTEFALLLLLGKALLLTKGYGAPEPAAVFARAREIGQRLTAPAQLVTMLVGLFAVTLMHDGPAAARSFADELMDAAQRAGLPWGLGWAHVAQAATRFYSADFAGAHEHSVVAVRFFEQATPQFAPLNPAIIATCYAAYAAWHLGAADEARQFGQQAIKLAEASARPPDRAGAYQMVAVLHGHMLGDLATAAATVELALTACEEEPNPGTEPTARVVRGWILAAQGHAKAGLEAMVPALELLASTGQRLQLPFALGLLADAYAAAGDVKQGQRMLDDIDSMSGAENFLANTLRRRAELLARDGADDAGVAAIYERALACAREQGTRAFELRAALSYARWLRDRGHPAEAGALLAPIHAGLREHFDTRDLREAGELLTALNASDRGSDPPLRSAQGEFRGPA